MIVQKYILLDLDCMKINDSSKIYSDIRVSVYFEGWTRPAVPWTSATVSMIMVQ